MDVYDIRIYFCLQIGGGDGGGGGGGDGGGGGGGGGGWNRKWQVVCWQL